MCVFASVCWEQRLVLVPIVTCAICAPALSENCTAHCMPVHLQLKHAWFVRRHTPPPNKTSNTCRKLSWDAATERLLDVGSIRGDELPSAAEQRYTATLWRMWRSLVGELLCLLVCLFVPLVSSSLVLLGIVLLISVCVVRLTQTHLRVVSPQLLSPAAPLSPPSHTNTHQHIYTPTHTPNTLNQQASQRCVRRWA